MERGDFVKFLRDCLVCFTPITVKNSKTIQWMEYNILVSAVAKTIFFISLNDSEKI